MNEQRTAPTERDARPGASTIRGARRVAIIAIIASMSITAIIGIFVLLSGDFGEVQGRILLTTLLVAGFSVTALCHLAIAGRPVRAVGYVGILVSGIALLFGVVVIWLEWGSGFPGELLRWFAVASIASASLAQANLLLLLSSRRRPVVRVALEITLGAIAIVALLLFLPILTDGDIPGTHGDGYWRWFGVIAIVDALGTIVLPIAARFVPERPVDAMAAPDTDVAAVTAGRAPAADGTQTARGPRRFGFGRGLELHAQVGRVYRSHRELACRHDSRSGAHPHHLEPFLIGVRGT